jgi:hypothetical protein
MTEILCDLQPTDRTDKKNRPIFECVNVGPDGRKCTNFMQGPKFQSPPCPAFGGMQEPSDLSCRFRREATIYEKVSIPGCCGKPSIVPVVLCTFGSGRACSLVEIGRSDVTCCAKCTDLQAPSGA